MDKAMVNLPCKRLQADEVWSFCYSKAKNVPEEKRGRFGFGDVRHRAVLGVPPVNSAVDAVRAAVVSQAISR